MNRGRRIILWTLLLGTAGILGFFYFVPAEPFAATPYSPALYARDGTLLSARLAADGQWRFVCGDPLPERYKTALIEQEDRRFRRHPGVDPLALVRAIVSNLEAGRVVSGGSTITMQLARLEGNRPRTIGSKIREAVRAIRLEAGRSKDDILAWYGCQVPMGGNIVGVETAAWGYFGRSSKELSWAESALLAVLPNDPALIYPGRQHDRLKQKRDRLLERLFRRGVISELDRDLAVAEPVPDRALGFPRKASYLLDTLTDTSAVRSFRSTIDTRTQGIAQRIFDEHAAGLRPRGVGNMALLIVENRSGKVRAYIGNTGPSATEGDGRDIDIVRSLRSTGSLLKPLLYAPMLEEGSLTTTMLVPDIPTVYKGYKPENFDRTYRGTVSASQALAASLNVPAVRLLKQFGVGRFRDLLIAAGMSTINRSNDDYGLSLILGGAEGSLFELTGLYAGMARRLLEGVDSPFFSRPVVLEGEQAPAMRFPAGPGAVWLVFESLVEANRPEGENFWKSFEDRRRIAWKTGTSIGMRDAWAIGTTPELTIGVWAGNADGRGVSGLTGLAVAAPLMFDLFRALPLPAGWFKRPDASLRTVSLCAESGYPATADCPAVTERVPLQAASALPCPYHRLIHLDREGRMVHSGCADVSSMRHESRFILPPVMEYYYRSYHPEYRGAPPWRGDCDVDRSGAADKVIGIVYPPAQTSIYIPVQLDGSRGKAVFKIVHRDPSEKVFWHIDDRFMGTTTLFHELEVDVAPGEHLLTVVDEEGSRAERRFTVLEKGEDAGRTLPLR